MNARWILGLFVGWAMVQVAVPLWQIWKHEDVRRTGAAYKLRTAPIDPYDVLRGRYVALRFADTEAPVRAGDAIGEHQPAYVRLETDAAGFARFVELSSKPPAHGDYLSVRCGALNQASGRMYFELPFDKFFMEETKAPRAERAFWQHGNRRDAPPNAYASVRVKKGRGVIEDLYLENIPIRDFLRQEPTGN